MTLKDFLIKLTVDCKQLTALEKAELIAAFEDKYKKLEKSAEGFLKFTEAELRQMSVAFRRQFKLTGNVAHVYRYKDKYEIRYARDGYEVNVAGHTLAEAKGAFIAQVKYA